MAKYQRKTRPGVTLYLEWLETLEELSAEQQGLLFISLLRYVRDEELPKFNDPVLKAVWPLLKNSADRDGTAYDQKCAKNTISRRFGAYKSQREKTGRGDDLEKDEWLGRAIGDGDQDIIDAVRTLGYDLTDFTSD